MIETAFVAGATALTWLTTFAVVLMLVRLPRANEEPQHNQEVRFYNDIERVTQSRKLPLVQEAPPDVRSASRPN
jgi:hypothetical protein